MAPTFLQISNLLASTFDETQVDRVRYGPSPEVRWEQTYVSSWWTPEHDLLVAILAGVVNDLDRRTGRGCSDPDERRRIEDDARSWLMSDSCAPFSFRAVCDHLCIEPTLIRSLILTSRIFETWGDIMAKPSGKANPVMWDRYRAEQARLRARREAKQAFADLSKKIRQAKKARDYELVKRLYGEQAKYAAIVWA